jgi:hypothetical protein
MDQRGSAANQSGGKPRALHTQALWGIYSAYEDF